MSKHETQPVLRMNVRRETEAKLVNLGKQIEDFEIKKKQLEELFKNSNDLLELFQDDLKNIDNIITQDDFKKQEEFFKKYIQEHNKSEALSKDFKKYLDNPNEPIPKEDLKKNFEVLRSEIVKILNALNEPEAAILKLEDEIKKLKDCITDTLDQELLFRCSSRYNCYNGNNI